MKENEKEWMCYNIWSPMYDLLQGEGRDELIAGLFPQCRPSLPTRWGSSKFPSRLGQAGFQAGSVLWAGHVNILLLSPAAMFHAAKWEVGRLGERFNSSSQPNLAPKTHRAGGSQNRNRLKCLRKLRLWHQPSLLLVTGTLSDNYALWFRDIVVSKIN